MLMRNPEYQSPATDNESKRGPVDHEPFVVHSAREMLLGQIVLILLLGIAILLRSMS